MYIVGALCNHANRKTVIGKIFFSATNKVSQKKYLPPKFCRNYTAAARRGYLSSSSKKEAYKAINNQEIKVKVSTIN
jgi:hypothetical protein